MLSASHKIKAGALQFAILISVVIAVTIGAFILLTHIQLKFSKQLEFSGRTIALSKTGINYAKHYEVPYQDSIYLSFESNRLEESVIIKKIHWGIFDKVLSQGSIKNFEHTQAALLGGSLDSLNRLALYLEDTNTPLVVAGRTMITGNVIVPSQGVKAGNIAGNYYQGRQLIDGNVSKTASKKPAIDEDKRAYFENILYNSTLPKEQELIALDSKAIKHTFLQPPKWIYKSGVIHLTDQSISNNIIIKSDSLIRVSAFAKAKNIILIAPHIVIEKNADVSLQAFASKSLVIEENARLRYPSALVLMEQNNRNRVDQIENKGIILKEGAIAEASIVHLSTNEETIRKPKLVINEGAVVRGEVYSDEWIELFGSVEGTVYASGLASRVRGSVYKNQLFNAVINSSQLSENYSGLSTNNSNKSIAQWVF